MITQEKIARLLKPIAAAVCAFFVTCLLVVMAGEPPSTSGPARFMLVFLLIYLSLLSGTWLTRLLRGDGLRASGVAVVRVHWWLLPLVILVGLHSSRSLDVLSLGLVVCFALLLKWYLSKSM